MSIAKVQDIGVKLTTGGSTSKTITISAPASGAMLSLFIGHVSSASISSVSGGGVTWSKVGNVTESATTSTIEHWVGHNSSGSGTTITIVVSNTYGAYECNFSEWSGTDTSGVADPAETTNSGTSNTMTTASVTPTAGKEVLLLACGVTLAHVTNTPSGSFSALACSATAQPASSSTNYAFAYRIVSSASGSYSTSWPLAVSYRPWGAMIGGWDAAGGASFIDNTQNVLNCIDGGIL